MRFSFAPIVLLVVIAGLAGCAKPPESQGSLGRTDSEAQVASQQIDTSISTGAIGALSRRDDLAGRDLWVGSAGDLQLRPGEVILTFDDGPSPTYTPRILQTLDDYGVSAVFFMVGSMAAAHPETAQAVALAGHAVGTHTIGHNNLARFTLASAVDKVIDGERAVAEALQPVNRVTAPFFRFPYLADSETLRTSLIESGLVIFDVDVDSLDYHHESSAQVLARALRRLDQEGQGIVLFHDIHARTARLLPDFFDALEERGYKIVRVRPRTRPFFETPLFAASN
jgi:peptidoglycan/xylan/chitin deacetylase (PgdA/CDA1 family)